MAIAKIQSMGFEPESFRFVKRYHRSEKRELTPQEKRRLPKYETFDLYVDFLVDSDDPKRFKVAGFSVMDEPLLARVFSGIRRRHNEDGRHQHFNALASTSDGDQGRISPS